MRRGAFLSARFCLTLVALLIIVVFDGAAADSVTLAWDPNLDQDIGGYRLHYGPASGVYMDVVDVGNNTIGTISGLLVGETYFVVVTAYDTEGLESPSSNEVSFVFEDALPQHPSEPSDPPPPEEPPPTPPPPDPTQPITEPPPPTIDPEPETPAEDSPPEPMVFSNTTFSGLIGPADGSVLRGFMTLRMTAARSATGQLLIDGKTYRWSGVFDMAGRIGVIIHRPAPLLSLVFTLSAGTQSNYLTGTITDGALVATIDLQRRMLPSDMALLPLRGRYTVAFLPDGASRYEPQGYGVGLLNVSPDGDVRLIGTVADGTKILRAGGLDSDGKFTFHTPLYGNEGFLCGTLTFRDRPQESDADGTLLWSKPPRPYDRRFCPAFAIQLPARAARYQEDARGAILSGLPPGGRALLSFTEGNLPAPVLPPYPAIVYMQRGTATLWAYGAPITFVVDPATGIFQGDFTPPDGRSRTFRGVLFQKGTGHGYGMFLDSTQTGRVDLAPE